MENCESGSLRGRRLVQVALTTRDLDRSRRFYRDTLGLTLLFEAGSEGADVVFQGTFFDGSFLSFADFLVQQAGVWEVYDTKLARTARVPALLQIAAYSRQLERLGVRVGPQAHLMLGEDRCRGRVSRADGRLYGYPQRLPGPAAARRGCRSRSRRAHDPAR